jgi:hypothetical protein
MNIYKVTNDYFCYDGYNGHIVLAESEFEAVKVCYWGDAEGSGNIVAVLIGTAISGAEKYTEENNESGSIFLSSYNAG